MDRERDEKGRYSEEVTPETVLDVLKEADDPVLTATEIADVLDVSRDTIRLKLQDLHERGKVDRKQVGARSVVWWIVNSSVTTDR
jgi:predicted ArsR family transcriptional regulator